MKMANMCSQVANWWKEWRVTERGLSSIAIFILGMPLILMAFGFGIDLMRVSYAQRIAQGRLDVAVQSAASLTYTNANGEVRLGRPSDGDFAAHSIQRAQQIYAENTANMRGAGSPYFSCGAGAVTQGGPRVVLNNRSQILSFAEENTSIWANTSCRGRAYAVYVDPTRSPLSRRGPAKTFDFCQRPASGKYGIKYEVVERVPTLFMRMVGGPQEFTIYVSSEALLRQQYC